MDVSTIILLVTTSTNLFISALDTLINGYIGIKDKKLHSDCCSGLCTIDYDSHSESTAEEHNNN
jgi:hypothetical protein